jgi:hypothetical protein
MKQNKAKQNTNKQTTQRKHSKLEYNEKGRTGIRKREERSSEKNCLER